MSARSSASRRATTSATRWRLAALSLVIAPALAATSISAANASASAYPGADGKIAFARGEQVFSINSNGTGSTQLTTSGKNDNPVWSPSGKRIAYIHETSTGSRQVWMMNANGSGKSQVTHLNFATPPSWSPDGKWLVFGGSSVLRDRKAVLEKVSSTVPYGSPIALKGNPDGSGLTTQTVDGSVSWSSDGRDIVFYSHDFPDSPDNYILNLNTNTHVVSEIQDVGGSCCGEGTFNDVTFSTSGAKVAFTDLSYDPDVESAPTLPIVTVVPFGEFESPLATGSVRGDRSPAFSPAGDHAVLTNVTGGTTKLYVTDASLRHRHLLTTGYQADWQPLH